MVRVSTSNIFKNSESKENILFLNEKLGLEPEWSYDGDSFYSGPSTFIFPGTDISLMDVISDESRYIIAGLGRGLSNIARIIDIGGVQYVYNKSHNPMGIGENKNQIFILSQLRGNPHFVQLLAAYVKDTNAYMINPYIPGKTLGEWLRDSHTEEEQKVVVTQSKEALDELHRFGLVHGDAHPDNLFVPDNLTTNPVFLIDFGGALYTNSEEEINGNYFRIKPIIHRYAPNTLKGGRRRRSRQRQRNTRRTKRKN